MRVLVIGGTKFIGPHVVRQLSDHGHQVAVFHRGKTEAHTPDSVRHIHHPCAEIPVREFPAEVFGFDPEVVIHMIAMGAADAEAAVEAFADRVDRIVWISSGDVYRAYGRLTGLEPGEPEPGLLTEDAPLRTVLYPYRKSARSEADLNHFYEKILVDQIARQRTANSVVLRLPKVYGAGGNADLAAVYRYRHQGNWRWTHGYVENVAQAIVLAATHPAAVGRIYNVGERYTPTVSERLASLPESDIAPDLDSGFCFAQDIAYDTSRIRRELGFDELVSYDEGIRRTLSAGGKGQD